MAFNNYLKNIDEIYVPEKVNVIGKANGYKNAPDNEFNIGVNNIIFKKNCEIGFHMHNNISKAYYERAYKQNTALITLENYPIKKIIQTFKISFFESSLDYIMAFLAYKNVKKINFYGIQMACYIEYVKQRPSFYYWMGFLKAKGVEINTNSSILKLNSNDFYGYFKDFKNDPKFKK